MFKMYTEDLKRSWMEWTGPTKMINLSLSVCVCVGGGGDPLSFELTYSFMQNS